MPRLKLAPLKLDDELPDALKLLEALEPEPGELEPHPAIASPSARASPMVLAVLFAFTTSPPCSAAPLFYETTDHNFQVGDRPCQWPAGDRCAKGLFWYWAALMTAKLVGIPARCPPSGQCLFLIENVSNIVTVSLPLT
jgi:hypothetical protein